MLGPLRLRVPLMSTIAHVELPKTAEELPEFRVGHWIAAGTPVTEPYPCTCWYSPCTYAKCPDRLRTEGDALPQGCCGRNAAPVAEPGFVPGRPADWSQKPAQTAVERSGGTEVPGSPVEGSSGVQGGARGPSSCDCRTPWDPPAPLLMFAATKDGPVTSVVSLPERCPDVRAEGDRVLAENGRERAKPWKDTRHTLLPPEPGQRGKTRPCWSAQLADGTLAVIDTPDETGSGVHCPDCCRDFANAGAYQLHRRRAPQGREVCADPATVTVVVRADVEPALVDLVGRVRAPSRVVQVHRGAPLLRRGVGGVWATDPKAPWGIDGPPFSPEEASGIWTRAQERLQAASVVCRAGHRSRWQCRGARCRFYQRAV